MAEYRFLTTWVLDADPHEVWNAIYDTESWPEWWRGIEDVQKLREGDENGVGAVYRHRWRSRMPYTVEFEVQTTRVELPHLIEADARGELAGVGRWRFYEGPGTAVTYEWHVRTTKPWMNTLAPVARPVFAYNHDVVMRQGGEGLARRLGVRLLAAG